MSLEQIPPNIRDSEVLTGHDLAVLRRVDRLPSEEEVQKFGQEPEVSAILQYFPDNPDEQLTELHKLAKVYLEQEDLDRAWKVLLQC